MIESQPCCAVTRNDLRAAHKRVAEVELQLLLLKAQNEELTAALSEEKSAHATTRVRGAAVVADLERQVRDAHDEIGTITRDRDNLRAAHANAIRNIQTEGKAA